MTKIGLLSDTHGFIDEKIIYFFKDVDEIWHAGDIGNLDVINKLSEHKIFRGVYGNIDGQDIRISLNEIIIFKIEEVKVAITHIAKLRGKFTPSLYSIIQKHKPQLVIGGHSHILQIKYEKSMNFLFVNPGAAGNNGIHHVKTACRFIIDGEKIKAMEILEKKRH